MAESWADLPGITKVNGHARLPRRPMVAAALFDAVCRLPEGTSMAELVAAVQTDVREEAVRLQGLAGWLPLSHVVQWEEQGLRRHPGTHPLDLALRYGAWVGSQPAPKDTMDSVTRYAQAVVGAITDRSSPPDGPWELDDPEGADVGAPAQPLAITLRIERMLAALDGAFVERQVHARTVLLAILAGQHALLLGPPGTAKSLLARGIARCFRDSTYFEYLLSRFSHPDELFGPISIPGLKEEDYRRLTQGFLPRAQVAFLDEIFKANSAILNSLLTLINERVFHHGRHRDPVPLLGMVGASNELPEADGGLGALFDRFLVRLHVPPVSSPDAFMAVATGGLPELQIDPADALTPEEVMELRATAESVVVPPAVEAALVSLWRSAAEAEWAVSDRRWRQAVSLLKMAAATEGRSSVGLLDLLLLEHVLPPEPSGAAEARDLLVDVVAPRAVPSHDLCAQWTLLRFDRVAPVAGEPLGATGSKDWEARVARRRVHVERLQQRADVAVRTLAADRRRLEGEHTRIWVSEPPARVLAAHLRGGRELAKVIDLAEAYHEELANPESIAGALIDRLPVPVRREFSAGVALRLRLVDTGRLVGLTHDGRRVSRPGGAATAAKDTGAGRLSRRGASRRSFEVEAFERAPELAISAADFLAFVRGGLGATELSERLDTHGAHASVAVLECVARHLGDGGLPPPPPYPRVVEVKG